MSGVVLSSIWFERAFRYTINLQYIAKGGKLMSGSFNTLSQSERIKVWQDIENKIVEALRQCEGQLAADASEEISDYLAHNELGLAWETLSEELVAQEVPLPESARQLLLEAGSRMGFDQAGTRNYKLWRGMADAIASNETT